MKYVRFLLLAGTLAVAGPAIAHHVEHLDEPFATRGACESASAQLSAEDRYWLGDAFPDVFSSDGEVESFLAKAFTCERHSDGQYYITDHRQEVLDSAWFAQRNH